MSLPIFFKYGGGWFKAVPALDWFDVSQSRIPIVLADGNGHTGRHLVVEVSFKLKVDNGQNKLKPYEIAVRQVSENPNKETGMAIIAQPVSQPPNL